MRVVADAELIRNRQQEGVGRGDGFVCSATSTSGSAAYDQPNTARVFPSKLPNWSLLRPWDDLQGFVGHQASGHRCTVFVHGNAVKLCLTTSTMMDGEQRQAVAVRGDASQND